MKKVKPSHIIDSFEQLAIADPFPGEVSSKAKIFVPPTKVDDFVYSVSRLNPKE